MTLTMTLARRASLLLVALLLLCFAFGAQAQDASPSPTAPPSPTPTPAPTAVPLPDIVSSSDSTSEGLKDIRSELFSNKTVDNITRELAATTKEIDARELETRRILRPGETHESRNQQRQAGLPGHRAGQYRKHRRNQDHGAVASRYLTHPGSGPEIHDKFSEMFLILAPS